MSSHTSLKDLIDEAILQEHHAIAECLLAELTRHLNNHRETLLGIVSAHEVMDPQPSSFENAKIHDPVKAINESGLDTQEIKDAPDLCTRSKKGTHTGGKTVFIGERLNELAGIDRMKATQNRGTVSKIVRSTAFEIATAGLIFALMVVMCAEAQYHGMNAGFELNMAGYARPGSESWPYAQHVFRALEISFNVMFTLELVLRLVALKSVFLKSGWFWLDFTLLSMSWLHSVGVLHIGLDPMLLRLLRLLELLRLVKVFKAFQVVDTLLLLIKSIQSSFSVLLWSFLLLMSVQTAAGIALSQLLSDFINDKSKPVQVRKQVFEYFGTMVNSSLTMFEIIQGNWVVSCRLLYNEVSKWYGLFYITFRCCAMFAVIKVITAVFIAETTRHANSDDELALTRKQRQKEAYVAKLKDVFIELDHSRDGFISWEELERLIDDDMLQSMLHTLDIDTNDLQYVFEVLDNGDNQIDFKEFMCGLTQVRGPAKGIEVFKLLVSVEKMEGTLNKLLEVVSDLQEQKQFGGAVHHCTVPLRNMSARPISNAEKAAGSDFFGI